MAEIQGEMRVVLIESSTDGDRITLEGSPSLPPEHRARFVFFLTPIMHAYGQVRPGQTWHAFLTAPWEQRSRASGGITAPTDPMMAGWEERLRERKGF